MNTPTPTQTQGGESATPRTDEAQILASFNEVEPPHYPRAFLAVTADFARRLERETATLRRERDELRAELLTTHQMACRVGLERDELRADKERLDWLLKESYEHKTCDALEDVYLSIRKGVGPADARIAIDCLIDSARAKQGEAP